MASSANGLTYADLINLWSKFNEYSLNSMIVDNGAMMKMLALDEFKNPATGLNFQATGKLTTPIGANLYKTKEAPANKIIAFDKNCALEMVSVSDLNIEYDKLIDRQLERAAITSIAGFAKIFADATKVLSLA